MMPAAPTGSGWPADGPTGDPTRQDVTHNPAAPRLAAIPAASTRVPGRDQATYAHRSWNVARAAKNTPDGNQSRQCIGTTAKWITAAPSEATAAQRAARRLSVFVRSRVAATEPTVTEDRGQYEQQRVTIKSHKNNRHAESQGLWPWRAAISVGQATTRRDKVQSKCKRFDAGFKRYDCPGADAVRIKNRS